MENNSNISPSISGNSFGKVALLVSSSNKNSSFLDILAVLQNNNIDVSVIDVLDEGLSLLDKSVWQDFSRVFIAITNRHKLSFGYIQGLLDILRLEYTGSGMLASALAGDIIKSKKIWQMHGIATAPFIRWQAALNFEEIISLIGFPLAVKSTYYNDHRIFKVLHMDQLQQVFKKFENLNQIIIEPWISGAEYIVYILDNKALLPLEVNNILISGSFGNHKKNPEYNKLLNVDDNLNNMQKLALDAFMSLGCSGFAEVSITKDLNGDCWVGSINTAPLLSLNSNFTTAAYSAEISFNMLVEKILASSFIKKVYDNLAINNG